MADQLKVDSINKVAVCALRGTGNRNRTCTVAHQILNLARLPVPPYPHISHRNYIAVAIQQEMRPSHTTGYIPLGSTFTDGLWTTVRLPTLKRFDDY